MEIYSPCPPQLSASLYEGRGYSSQIKYSSRPFYLYAPARALSYYDHQERKEWSLFHVERRIHNDSTSSAPDSPLFLHGSPASPCRSISESLCYSSLGGCRAPPNNKKRKPLPQISCNIRPCNFLIISKVKAGQKK